MHAPVPSYHEVDDHSRDVDVRDRREAFVEHVFAEPGVTAAHHENIVVLAYVLQNPILQPGIALTGTNIWGKGVSGASLSCSRGCWGCVYQRRQARNTGLCERDGRGKTTLTTPRLQPYTYVHEPCWSVPWCSFC